MRLSVGIESGDDLVADLAQALDTRPVGRSSAGEVGGDCPCRGNTLVRELDRTGRHGDPGRLEDGGGTDESVTARGRTRSAAAALVAAVAIVAAAGAAGAGAAPRRSTAAAHPRRSVTPPATHLTIAPQMLKLGNQRVGTFFVGKSVVITNTGTLPISMDQIVYSGGDQSDFVVGTDCFPERPSLDPEARRVVRDPGGVHAADVRSPHGDAERRRLRAGLAADR